MADVKLLESQRLTDNADGGGRMTSVEVVDGQINNLFPDISRIDRVNGRVNLRKAFAMATTADDDLFSGLHVIVSMPPQDPRVSGIVFTTEDWTDVRSQAKDYIEGYLAEGPATRMFVYDTQLAGQRAVTVYQRPDVPLPEIGNVYVLDDTAASFRQFVRLLALEHSVQTFTDELGDYQLRVMTLEMTQPLNHTFPGAQPQRRSVPPSPTLVRSTNVADRAHYYGVVPFALDADAGDFTIKCESIFGQLVPSTNSEAPVTDASPAGSRAVLAAAETEIVWNSSGSGVIMRQTIGPGDVYFETPFTPGSLVASHNSKTATDDGLGNLIYGGGVVALIDYEQGKISTQSGDVVFWSSSSPLELTYLPGGVITPATYSTQLPVSLSTRGYVYQSSLKPAPAPGTVVVSYRSFGRWYDLVDQGDGSLTAEAGIGVGTVNYATGAVVVTLGALPDVGSAIMFAWGGVAEYAIREGDVDIDTPDVTFTVAEGGIEPGTLTITWTVGMATKTATDDGAGELTGDGTGRVTYGSGKVTLRPAVLPAPNTVFAVEYDAGAIEQETFHPSLAGSSITVTAANAPIRPGSILIQYQVHAGPIASLTVQLVDDGAGNLLFRGIADVPSAVINYTTGEITFEPNYNWQGPFVPTYEQILGRALPSRTSNPDLDRYVALLRSQSGAPLAGWNSEDLWLFTSGDAVSLWYKQDGAIDETVNEDVDAPAITFDATPLINDAIVSGSLMFTFGGRTYVERNGTLYSNVSHVTNSGTPAGTVDLASGEVSVTQWDAAGSQAVVLKSLLTKRGDLPIDVVSFRTPGSPLRPASFTITATRYRDGASINASADVNGNIDTSAMHGFVDTEMGVVFVAFGRYVLDSTLTTDEKLEPWYDAGSVDGDGYIWRPDEVIGASIRYSCVVQTFLPLDPDILGLDPTRLPLDGRVPVIRAGDTLVIHDTQTDSLPPDLEAGQEIELPRDSLAEVLLYDANGLLVPAAKFSVALDTGIITMADPLDLTGYVEPLVAAHRIEDMVLALDAQITGQVTLSQALTHDYTAANSLVSSALVAGDVQARYGTMFEQNTWTNVWSDTQIGASPVSGAQFDDVTYPLAVLNRDAISQRWRIQFTSSSAFNVIGETLGVIATGTTASDVAPLNPATGHPYFQLNKNGFGTGWATGNVIRFNTYGAGSPVWIARTILSGPPTVLDDQMKLQLRWDKD